VATLRYYAYWEVDLNGAKLTGGSRAAPVEYTVTQNDGNTQVLATATSDTLWTSANTPTDFDFFYIKSTQALKLELTVDRAGDNGSQEIVLLVPANTPFVLPMNDALANYSGTLSGGTADVIDEIVCRNESGSDATITWALFT
jgi:hypothetical protein